MAATARPEAQGSKGPMGLAAALESSVRQLPWKATADRTAVVAGDRVQAAAVYTESVLGECGGSANFTLNVNENTGAFNGAMTYNGYCSGGVVLSGTVNMSGSFNESAGVVNITMNFVSLTLSLAGESFSTDGSMSMSMNVNSKAVTISYNMVMANSLTDKSAYLLYSITYTPQIGYDEFTLSGRFYAHDYGYVQLSTEQPLRRTFQHPEAGTIRIGGDTGSWARLEFIGNGRYVITCSDGTSTQGLLN
jgi:hypothetical protein